LLNKYYEYLLGKEMSEHKNHYQCCCIKDCHKHCHKRHHKNDRIDHKDDRIDHLDENLLKGGIVKAVYMAYKDLQSLGSIDTTIKRTIDYGYNLIILAFWINPTTGVDPYSAADLWSKLSQTQQLDTINYAHDHGAQIIVSLGGSTYNGYTVNGGYSYGTAGANFALANNLDGVDFDFEGFTNTFGTTTGMNKSQVIQFLTDATIAARNVLGSNATITHAPQSPYFNIEFDNGYYDFYIQTPHPPLDYFLIQYYNQGDTYKTYQTQFINNDNFHPNTAIAQLISRNIPKEVIVMGKLTQQNDGQAVSWVDPETIHSWVETSANDPQTQNWTTGVSTWQFNLTGEPTSQRWIQTIYP
jgi:chitinase